MTRVEPLIVGIKVFEAVDTSEGHSGICDLGLFTEGGRKFAKCLLLHGRDVQHKLSLKL